MRRILIGSTAAACALALVTAGGAFARAGDRTAALTYPVASALCVSAHNDVLPPAHRRQDAGARRLRHAAERLRAARRDRRRAEATLLSTLSTQKGLVSAACPRPVVNADRLPGRARDRDQRRRFGAAHGGWRRDGVPHRGRGEPHHLLDDDPVAAQRRLSGPRPCSCAGH